MKLIRFLGIVGALACSVEAYAAQSKIMIRDDVWNVTEVAPSSLTHYCTADCRDIFIERPVWRLFLDEKATVRHAKLSKVDKNNILWFIFDNRAHTLAEIKNVRRALNWRGPLLVTAIVAAIAYRKEIKNGVKKLFGGDSATPQQ